MKEARVLNGPHKGEVVFILQSPRNGKVQCLTLDGAKTFAVSDLKYL